MIGRPVGRSALLPSKRADARGYIAYAISGKRMMPIGRDRESDRQAGSSI